MRIKTDKQVAMNVSAISIFINILLAMLKLFAGIIAKSGAMISDAVHSASDVFSTFIVMIGVNIANKESDEEHPYGHERLECIAAIILAVVLCATGIGIGYNGIQKIINSNNTNLQIPGILALITAVISILVKEWMYWYTRTAAKKINSDALMADAWHHRSDSLSSIGSFIGIFGARMGFPILDPIASIIICIFIIKAAYDIFAEASGKLVDKACDQATTEKMKELILSQEKVNSLDDIKTRRFGSKVYVDIEIGADENLTFKEVHEVAEKVHSSIEGNFKDVKHCTVHANPVSIKIPSK